MPTMCIPIVWIACQEFLNKKQLRVDEKSAKNGTDPFRGIFISRKIHFAEFFSMKWIVREVNFREVDLNSNRLIAKKIGAEKTTASKIFCSD